MVKEIEYPSFSASSGGVGNISWGAVFAGTFVVIATMAALSMLGAGIGLASAPAADSAAGLAKGLGIGAVIWLFLSGIASFYAGGWMTGRLTRTGIVSDSVAHSVVTWAFATTAFLFLLTSAVGGALGGAASLIGGSAKLGTASASAYASRAPERARQLSQAAETQVERLSQEAQANVPSREIAQKAATASKAAGATGIAGFFMLLVEALACAAGGRSGTRVLRPRMVNNVRTRETAPVS